jgi:hypothetical protein
MQSTKTTEREFSAISFETSYKTIGVNLSPVRADLFVFIIIFIIFYFYKFLLFRLAQPNITAKLQRGSEGRFVAKTMSPKFFVFARHVDLCQRDTQGNYYQRLTTF